MAQNLINRPTLFGFSVQTLGVMEPRIDRFSVDPTTSAPIRWGDPVKQIAGGNIVRCTPADTALLGFAATGQNNVLPASIASAPLLTDTAGNPLVSVYLADALTIFTGNTVAAPAQSNILQTHDLQYAIPASPTPTVAQVPGAVAGSTTYAYVVSALTPLGEAPVGSAGALSTGNAMLSAANGNLVTIPQTSRASSYNVWLSLGGGTYAFVGNVAANPSGNTVFTDAGQGNRSAVPIPPVNNTGWLVNNTAQSTNVLEVRSIDTKPITPFISTSNVGAVLFAVTAAKSQVQNIAGS